MLRDVGIVSSRGLDSLPPNGLRGATCVENVGRYSALFVVSCPLSLDLEYSVLWVTPYSGFLRNAS